MRTYSRSGVSCLLLLMVAGPARAFDIFLDYNTDDDPNTFVNYVVGPEIVPIDLVVSIDAEDVARLNGGTITAFVNWGYGGSDPEDPGCSELRGNIEFNSYDPLPDQEPFTNIVAYTCVCLNGVRCSCDAEMIVDADVTGLSEPGNYLLARLNYSRWGWSLKNCGKATLWPQAIFESHCISPLCPGTDDPRHLMFLQESATSPGDGVSSSTWGRVKSLYR